MSGPSYLDRRGNEWSYGPDGLMRSRTVTLRGVPFDVCQLNWGPLEPIPAVPADPEAHLAASVKAATNKILAEVWDAGFAAANGWHIRTQPRPLNPFKREDTYAAQKDALDRWNAVKNPEGVDFLPHHGKHDLGDEEGVSRI